MSQFTLCVAEGKAVVEEAAMGIGEVDQDILDSGMGGIFQVLDTEVTASMDPDGGEVMERLDPIGDHIGEAIIRIPITAVIPILVMDT